MIRLGRLRWWQIAAIMPIELDLFGAERWTAGMFWSELAEHASRHYLTAIEGDDIVGYGGLSTYGPDSYIQTLGVRRDRQGAGIGRALLQALVGEAERREARTIALEVRADNPVAQRLYARHGFEPVGRRKAYYQPSGIDAVVMVRRAS